MEKQEEWRPVEGYEGLYEVSDWGRVKSLNFNNTGKEGILKPSPNGHGYLQVKLYKNGEKSMRRVHILVMQAFVGKCPKNHEIDHYDWNRKNNRLDNLSYQPKKTNRARRSPEGMQNVSEANKKKAQDPEWRKKQAEAMKKLAQDPEWRKNVSEAAKRRAADPEWIKNHAETIKKRSENPNWRKNQAEATRKANSKPVDQFTLDGKFVKRWPSATDAARELGINHGKISLCCNGKRKKTGGFVWRYAQ